MRREPVRAATLALAALLACCRNETPPLAYTANAASSPCRAGPDGAPVADRGIGGTGSPVLTADRGIGGTGIIGVITGFGSVCLAGQEVSLPPDVRVNVGQRPASTDSLRAGQVAVIEAASAPAGLSARQIVIRYEVVGRVDRVAGDMLSIAGQDVSLSPQTWGRRPARGDFVAVSGLRRGDGTIEATRVDPEPPGPVLVHGILVEQAGGVRIGALSIRREPATVALTGSEVTVVGMVGPNGELLPTSVVPDLLVIDPAAYFGPSVGVVLIEGFGVIDSGRLRLAPMFSAPASGVRFQGPQRGVFRFERAAGSLRATGFGTAPAVAAPASLESVPRFEPAPVPNRALSGPSTGRTDRSGSGNRGQRGRFGRDRSEDTSSPGPTNGPSSFGLPAAPRGR